VTADYKQERGSTGDSDVTIHYRQGRGSIGADDTTTQQRQEGEREWIQVLTAKTSLAPTKRFNVVRKFFSFNITAGGQYLTGLLASECISHYMSPMASSWLRGSILRLPSIKTYICYLWEHIFSTIRKVTKLFNKSSAMSTQNTFRAVNNTSLC
jgi:hypothetical protein